jgi:hypothetical protein
MNIKLRLSMWKYRFLGWFVYKPDDLKRRVDVENALLSAYKSNRSIPPDEARDLALKLGVPTWLKKKM